MQISSEFRQIRESVSSVCVCVCVCVKDILLQQPYNLRKLRMTSKAFKCEGPRLDIARGIGAIDRTTLQKTQGHNLKCCAFPCSESRKSPPNFGFHVLRGVTFSECTWILKNGMFVSPKLYTYTITSGNQKRFQNARMGNQSS